MSAPTISPLANDPGPLSRCMEVHCSLHDTHGCSLRGFVTRSRVALVLDDATGGLAQAACALIDILSQGPSNDKRENLSLAALKLLNMSRTGDPNQLIDIRYLRRAIKNEAIDESRRWLGPLVCGTCAHFGKYSHRCLARATVYLNTIDPSQSPKTLVPPCGSHTRDPSAAGIAVVHKTTSKHARVMRGLALLAPEDPLGASVLVTFHFYGASLRDLQGDLHIDRRRLSKIKRKAERRLGQILDDLEDIEGPYQ